MYRNAVTVDPKRRRGVLLTAFILGLIALIFYVGTFVLRHYGKY